MIPGGGRGRPPFPVEFCRSAHQSFAQPAGPLSHLHQFTFARPQQGIKFVDAFGDLGAPSPRRGQVDSRFGIATQPPSTDGAQSQPKKCSQN